MQGYSLAYFGKEAGRTACSPGKTPGLHDSAKSWYAKYRKGCTIYRMRVRKRKHRVPFAAEMKMARLHRVRGRTQCGAGQIGKDVSCWRETASIAITAPRRSRVAARWLRQAAAVFA